MPKPLVFSFFFFFLLGSYLLKHLSMAPGCIRGGSAWILGKVALLKEWSGIGTGRPGKQWSHHPWRRSKNV